jgi:hypothetical protein
LNPLGGVLAASAAKLRQPIDLARAGDELQP